MARMEGKGPAMVRMEVREAGPVLGARGGGSGHQRWKLRLNRVSPGPSCLLDVLFLCLCLLNTYYVQGIGLWLQEGAALAIGFQLLT